MDESTLEWLGVLPADGWYQLSFRNKFTVDTEAGEYFDLYRLVGWAWVMISEKGQDYHALVGIITDPAPNFEGPPGLCDVRARYVHESEITQERRELWSSAARYRLSLEEAEEQTPEPPPIDKPAD